jgi:hypothetical protein
MKNDSVPWRLFKPVGSSDEWCVLWLQGWTSSMDSHVDGTRRMSNDSGMPFATLDYAGHGLHKLPLEQSTRAQQLSEVIGVYDELKKLGYSKIIVIGGSFGGYMAALLAGKRPVHTVMLRVPAMYPDNEFSMLHKETVEYTDLTRHRINRGLKTYVNNIAVDAIKNYDGFVYILEHELDSVIPQQIPLAYFNAARHGNYQIIPKADHSPRDMPNSKQYYDYIELVVLSILKEINQADTLG